MYCNNTLLCITPGMLRVLVFLCLSFLLNSLQAEESKFNGFNLKSSIISPNENRSGGPGRDGIQSIENPSSITIKDAFKKYDLEGRAILVRYKKDVKKYPISILNWHEINNDTIGNIPIVVTYCPL